MAEATPLRDIEGQDETKRELWDMRWVRVPQQSRSAKTRARLLDATQQLLDSEGLDGLTMAKVAKLAGCSVGSLYHHFQDKRAIIYSVIDRFAAEVALTAQDGLKPELWQGVGLLEVLEGYLRFSLKLYRRFPGTFAAQRALATQDPHVEARLHQSRQDNRRLLMGLIEPRAHEITHPDPQLALDTALMMLRSVLQHRQYLLLPGVRVVEPKRSDRVLVREVVAMLGSYLGINGSTAAARGKD